MEPYVAAPLKMLLRPPLKNLWMEQASLSQYRRTSHF